MNDESLICRAAYNAWADAKLLTSLSFLSSDEFSKNRDGFFGSLLGVMNHRIVADEIWWARLQGFPPPAHALDAQVAETLDDVQRQMQRNSSNWIDFVKTVPNRPSMVSYQNMSGVAFKRPLTLVLSHVFNHATHHRGQAHHMLSMAGAEPPSLDLIYFLDEWLDDR